ncbi:hypothetical protein K458DRAFT_418961 [Lentithecium fluviatile CBS 122367]|uniref:Rhodopsin domain-containing protein n=1 Tax=Lentithecium fluviatile CBS 122367 TaxID=1168545 RepID=A0A6G1IYK9_9PLEO|nr:hypothetical protein K458DRAFT_418961 [Lentithecium fluviatile CBS 122367]
MKHPSPDQLAYMQAHIDETRQPWLIGANVAFLIVAFVSVALRFTARIKIGTHIGLDDWLIFSAALCVLGHVTCLLITTTRNNFGRHIILVEDARGFTLVTLTAQTFYNLSIPFAKLSILCLYNRIFRRTTGWFMPTLWVSALFVFLSAIPPVFVYIFQCVPIYGLWTDMPPGEHMSCLNFKAAIIAFGVINILSDIYILVLPIPVVLSLQLEKRTKWSVCSLFLVGSVVCIISIVRLVYAKNVETIDPTWDFVIIGILSTLESSAAVMVACMPTWRPLFRFLGRGITSYFSGSNGKSGNGGDAENLRYGNNIAIGRGRWPSMSRGGQPAHDKDNLSSSGVKGARISFILGQKRSDTSMSGESAEKIWRGQDIEMDITNTKSSPSITTTDQATERNSSGSTRAPTPIRATTPIVASPNSNRTITTTSSSKENPSTAHTSNKSSARLPPRSVPDITFSNASPEYTYKASAGADRWESLMKQQQIKNKAKEKSKRHSGEKAKAGKKARYGEVAFGGGTVRGTGDEGESEGRLNGGLGLGLEGISVTKTVVSVSDGGR